MIIFFGDGELGNQLFQYAFLTKVIKKKELLITTNFAKILKVTKINKAINILNLKNKYLIFFSRRVLIFFFQFLSYIRAIHSINVKKKRIFGTVREESFTIFKKGIFPITFVYPCFFQSEFFFKKISNKDFFFKKKHISQALNLLNKIPKNFNPVFVHVHQGKAFSNDKQSYKAIKFLGKAGIALPIQYYVSQILWFKKNIDNPFFIFLTDSYEFVKKEFSSVKYKIISNNEDAVDLQIMIHCKYGIMSNSSFSWWGGYLMKKRKIVFGAKYWLGWKKKVVFQTGGEPLFAKLVDPNKFIFEE